MLLNNSPEKRALPIANTSRFGRLSIVVPMLRRLIERHSSSLITSRIIRRSPSESSIPSLFLAVLALLASLTAAGDANEPGTLRHARIVSVVADPDKVIAAVRREHQALDSIH